MYWYKMLQTDFRRITSSILLTIYLSLFFLVPSCKIGKDQKIPEFQPDASNSTLGDISDRLVARIYFDATLSMQGFVIPSSTQYTQMCRYLESVIVSGWENATVKFFRFGEKVESINRSTYLNLSQTAFYENSRIFRETFIQKIIDHEVQLTPDEVEDSVTTEESTETVSIPEETNNNGKESQLVVIVTDLFQDNRDLTVLVTQLKEQYIQKGYEVGLLGLRSEFDGTVYDLGEAPLPYRSTSGKPETFRPFYLLVLGRHADISHYFDRLIANGFSDAQTVIFSRYLVNPLLSFGGGKEIKTDNLNRKIINPKYSQTSSLKQYEIVDNSKPASISAKMECVPLPHSMSYDSDMFEVSTISKDNDDEEIKISKAETCLKVIPTISKNNDNNELKVEFSLDSPSLPRKTVYLYEVTLSPNVDTFQAPEWCSKWDMGDERNGAKTLNLVNFVRDLSLVTARTHRPQIAKFHCYIGKR